MKFQEKGERGNNWKYVKVPTFPRPPGCVGQCVVRFPNHYFKISWGTWLVTSQRGTCNKRCSKLYITWISYLRIQWLQFSKFHMQFDIQYMRITCVILRHRYIVKDILHHICCVCKLYSPGSVHLASGLGLTWTKIQAIMIQAMP